MVTPHQRRGDRVAAVLLGAAMLITFVACMRVARGMTFWYDDWTFATLRRPWTVDSFLMPHNEHLMLVTATLYKVLFELAGTHYGIYRVFAALEHLLVAGLLFAYARRRGLDPWLALAAAVLVLALGAGYEVILWPVNTGFLTSLAAYLGALIALDARSRRGDVAACLLTLLSVCSSSAGIAVLLGLAVEVLGRSDRRERWWIVVVPAVVYAAWRLGYHPPSSAKRDNVAQLLSYGSDSAASASGGLLALGVEWGRLLLVGGLALLVPRLLRLASLTPRVAGILAVPLLFWAFQTISRADLNDPGASRYLYVGAVLILLVAVQSAGALRVPDVRVLALAGVVVLLAGLGGAVKLRDGGRYFRNDSQIVAAELGAVRIAQDVARPDAQPDPLRAPQLDVASTLGVDRGIGEVGWSEARLRGGGSSGRLAADVALVSLERIAGVDASGCSPRRRVPAGSELTVVPGQTATVRWPQGGSYTLRRFGPVGGSRTDVSAGRTLTLGFPRDRASDRWVVRLDAPGPVDVCG